MGKTVKGKITVNLYSEKIYFKNKNEIDFFRYTRAERIHYQQTCTARN